jgi:perosamine synthetase
MIKSASPQINEDDLLAVRKVLASGQLVSGPRVAEFENNFATYIGTREAVAVNSGTAAIHSALAAAGIRPGDEVIVPALTFFSTVTAIIHQGAVPIFADISLSNYSLDPNDCKNRITERTRALLPVHYFGHAAEMETFLNIANEHKLILVEDCAQSHGTMYKDKKTGSIGDMGCFSFFATKHMTTGEGGIVTTNNSEYAEYMRSFRNHGMRSRHEHSILGYNYRMPEMAGALGVSQLRKLEKFNEARIERSEKIIEHIQDIPWLNVPEIPSHVRHTYFWCHILIDEGTLGMDTQDLIEYLKARGVEVRNRYLEPLYRQPLLTKNIPAILRLSAGQHLPDYGNLSLPNSERVAGSIIGLPNRPDMTDAEIEELIEILHGVPVTGRLSDD